MSDSDAALLIDQPQAVREGLPLETFTALARFLDLPLTQMAEQVGMAPRTLKRRMEEKRFKPDESDRIARVGRIAHLALEAFGCDREAARTWLKSPHALLDDEPPLQRLDTEVGTRAVEDLLNAIRYGFSA